MLKQICEEWQQTVVKFSIGVLGSASHLFYILYFSDFHVWFIMDMERVTADIILELKKA